MRPDEENMTTVKKKAELAEKKFIKEYIEHSLRYNDYELIHGKKFIDHDSANRILNQKKVKYYGSI